MSGDRPDTPFYPARKEMAGAVDLALLTDYLTRYGAAAVFVIVLLEYLNLPGFPAGIIMPAAGICAARGGLSFPLTLLLSVMAGLIGSWILYMLGRYGGGPLLDWFSRKFPRQGAHVDALLLRMRSGGGYWGLLIAKLIPNIRTLISIPAGAARMNFMGYTLFSLLGITVWNAFFIGAGYLLGDTAFRMIGLA